MKPSDLNADLIQKTFTDLSEGAAAGVGKKWNAAYKKDGEDTLVTSLKKNLYTFASAKTFAQLETLNKMLYSQDGKLRPFNEYSQLARKVNAQYNKNWLQAEHQTAKTAGQMAVKWQRIQRDKDLFPNLKYRTVGDDKVRDEHAALNGTIKPVDDPFWSSHYPPNGWRCRCNVVQTAEDATNDKITTQPNPVFEGNVATDEVIFSKKHQFFQLLNTDKLAVRNAELMKLNAPYKLEHESPNGKKLEVNLFAHEVDKKDNILIGKLIVDQYKIDLKIRPHLDGQIVKKYKNPEYLINNKIADRKAPLSKDYSGTLSKANKQGCKIVVYDLSLNMDTITNAEKSIKSLLSKATKEGIVHPNIEEIYIISADKSSIKYFKREKAN